MAKTIEGTKNGNLSGSLELKQKLNQLCAEMSAAEVHQKTVLESIPAKRRKSAQNLIHYLSLRRNDIREIQDQLHKLGLSSLASSEGNILEQLKKVISWLEGTIPELSLDSSQTTLNKNSKALFGEPLNKFIPNIMVTYDADFENNIDFINNLLHHGMSIARINTAHDSEKTWNSFIRDTRSASELNGHEVKIYMDLAGPKIRTILLGKGKKDGKIKLKEGDIVYLVESNEKFNKRKLVFGISAPGIIAQLEKDDRILFDDGIIEGKITACKKGKCTVLIQRISGEKSNLKSGKGINFPGKKLVISPLTPYDEICLPFICENADLIGYSFVQKPSDIELIQEKLTQMNRRDFPLVLKIETQLAVENLPELLLTSLKYGVPAVMIARGDLAVEIGFERLSEIQDEILWICEAAHVPVIWATQVLENLNKKGIPTRAEVTDSAHASMAECVMINKGENTIAVLKSLKEILNRNGRHHWKKRNMMRKLKIAEDYFNFST